LPGRVTFAFSKEVSVSSPKLARTDQHTNRSIWNAGEPAPFVPLERNEQCDVCVVGAGIAGLTIAYFLAREGRSVIVLEKNSTGQGETINTSAHLSNVIDAGYREIERYHGEHGSRLAANSHNAAIAAIESIVHKESIDCEFSRTDGYLFLDSSDSSKALEDEFDAARRAGVDVEKSHNPLIPLANDFCLRFPNQAKFHAGKYIHGLASAARKAGVRIFTGTEVGEVRDGPPVHVRTIHGSSVAAPFAVVASNTPFNDRVAMHTKQAAYRTYIIGVPIPSATIHDALYWDTADPFHYVRLAKLVDNGKSRDILLIGGEDHKTGQIEEIENRFARLLSWGRTHFGDLGDPEFRWSGQIMDSADGLAFIGRNPGDPNVFIVTGDSGVGLTHGSIAGILITDLIQRRSNPWETLYDPSRKMVRAAAEFARENLNTAAQYADWLTAGDVTDPNEIRPGSGAIVRHGLTKIAVYRDDSGALHRYSAVCPHLGGIVAWNPTESSWDCPCHGSRFDCFGKVLNGPAADPLKAAF
jgi:glycine/D-amino acid oxidase-like deaminating enzyme/nitrite reductase/ring-hydroxylating ferredoxin subunit